MARSNIGLSSLMEAINHSEREEIASEEMTQLFEEAIDDDVIDAVNGDNFDNDVEDDMDGDGIGDDDEELEALIAKIPPADNIDEHRLEEFEDAIESCIPVGI